MNVSLATGKMSLSRILATVLVLTSFATSIAAPAQQQPATRSDGAKIFVDRCVLCHGNYGAGDGFMPLLIEDYPKTNLLKAKAGGHFTDLQEKIKWGGAQGTMNDLSPPWVDELTTSEMKAVAQFVIELKTDSEKAWRSLDKYSAEKPVSIETGRLVYETRCLVCHGSSGQGDGPMAAIVKKPPPYNLVTSQLSESDLKRVISLGGATVGRSAQMPAWQRELSTVQIDSVIKYVQQFRQ